MIESPGYTDCLAAGKNGADARWPALTRWRANTLIVQGGSSYHCQDVMRSETDVMLFAQPESSVGLEDLLDGFMCAS